MIIRSSFLSGALKLGTGQVVVQFCSFLRSMILARLISPENFGIAATFAMTFSLLEMISNISAQSLLIQAPDGDEATFQATGHFLLILRGFINSGLLLLAAFPLSSLFGVSQARWAFYWIAAIPLMSGFNHLDLCRFQRNMRFSPQITVEIVSSLLVTLLAWPLAAWLRDYSAMLWLLLLQTAVYNIGSHVVAERRYTWIWRFDYARRFFVFGWPLLINGLLMYGILQGDRFVIGASRHLFSHSVYTLADLGIYSVAFAVTMAPSMLITNVANSLFLPTLARTQTEPGQFLKRYMICTQTLAFAATTVSIPFIVAGHWIVPIVYGPKYSAAGAFIGWLGAMWGVRIFRAGPTLAAMALGDTQNAMVANIVRTTALGGIVIVAATGGPLVSIAICSFVGEVLATVVCVGRLSAKHKISSNLVLLPSTVCSIGMTLAMVTKFWAAGIGVSIGITIGLLFLCAATILLCFPDIRHYFYAFLPFSQRATESRRTTT